MADANVPEESLVDKVTGYFTSPLEAPLQAAAETTVGKKAFGVIDYLARPYRDDVAPNLSAALMTINSNYNEQNPTLSTTELFNKAKADAVASSAEYYNDPSQSWRRKISPGRALVGLIGDTLPGEQAVDKINWSDAKEVEGFFSQGAPQLFSGLGDAGFNSLDPVFLAGKGASVARKAALQPSVKNGTVKFLGKDYMDVLDKDITKAVAKDEGPIAPLFQMLDKKAPTPKGKEKFVYDTLAIRGYGVVSQSANPDKLAQALIDAHKIGGRGLAADTLRIALGDTAAFKRVSDRYVAMRPQLNAVTGRLDAVEEHIADLQAQILPSPTKKMKLSAEKIAEIESFNKKTSTDIKKLEKEANKIRKQELDPLLKQEKFHSEVSGALPTTAEESAKMAMESGQKGVFGYANETWSRSEWIEARRMRNAELKARGFWNETSHDTPTFSGDVASAAGLPQRFLYTIDWLSPNAKLHETPAGTVYLDGVPGEFAQQEIDSRIRQAVKFGDMSTKRAITKSRAFSALTNASERYKFADSLQFESFVGMVRKLHPEVKDFTQEQTQQLYDVLSLMHQNTVKKQRDMIGDVIDKNYTMIDSKQGQIIANNHVRNMVENAAMSIAKKRGATSYTQLDLETAKRSLREDPNLTSQIPNQHVSVDLREINSILKSNPFIMTSIVDSIKRGEKNVISEVKRHGESVMTAGAPGKLETLSIIGQAAVKQPLNKLTDALDAYYTFVWKPTTLFSAKYTTRNVLEGWLRVGASMIDMNTALGFGWSDMVRGFNQGRLSSVPDTFGNIYRRANSKRNNSKFNDLNNQILVQDAAIQKNAGNLIPDAKKAADKIIKDSRKAANDTVIKANDGLSMATHVTIGKFEKIARAVGGGAIDQSAKEINGIYDLLNEVIDGNTVGKEFVDNLFNSDFRTASAALVKLDVVEANAALDFVTKLSKDTFNDIKSIDLSKSGPILKTDTEELLHYLGRMEVHIDHLRTFLNDRAVLAGKVNDLTGRLIAEKKQNFVKDVKLTGGATISGALGGDSGQMMRNTTSAHASNMKMLDRENYATGAHILNSGTRSKAMDIDNPKWAAAHAEYVNNVLMNDAVAKRGIDNLASGMSLTETYEEILTWVKSNDPEAVRWMRESKESLAMRNERIPTTWKDEVRNILEGQVMVHLKPVDGFGNELLEKASRKELTAIDSSTIPMSIRNRVDGDIALRSDNMAGIAKNIVRTIFHFIGSLPEDHLVRHPFYNMVHNSEAERLARLISSQGKDVSKYSAQIKNAASTRAYKELMNRLYSVERYTDLATLMRFVSPFYMAHQNTSRFWIGTTLRNPQTAIALSRLYNAPFRAGLVQDQYGNVLEYSDPWHSDKQTIVYMIDDIPFLSKKTKEALKEKTGKDFIGFQPGQTDVVTQGQPLVLPSIGGPAGTFIATNAFKVLTDRNYDANPIMKKLGITVEGLQKTILPYYEKTYDKSAIGQLGSSLSPANSWMTSLVAAVLQGKSSDKGALGAILSTLSPDSITRFQTRYEAAYDQIAVEKNLNGQAINDEEISKLARERATNSLFVEMVTAFTGPVAAGKLGNKDFTSIQQEYRTIQNANPGDQDAAALEMTKRLESRASDPLLAPAVLKVLTTRSASNRYGLWATQKTAQNFKKNRALVEQIDSGSPDNSILGIFFNEGDTATEYNAIVDDSYFSETINGKPLRARLTNDVERRRAQELSTGWEVYTNGVEQIEKEASDLGYVKGTSAYNNYYGVWKKNWEAIVGEQYPNWAIRVQEIGVNKSDINIAIMNKFLNDKNYMSTVGNNLEVVKGIKEYFIYREGIKKELDDWRAKTGTTGIDTKANRWFAEWRDNAVKEVIIKHPAFEPIYKRYLQDDEFNDVVEYTALNQ